MTMLQSNTTTVAGRLSESRRMAGLSLRGIAPLVGVGYATASRWENGESEPSITQFALWAAATKQPLDRMIEGLEWCTPSDLNREPTDSEFWAIVDRFQLEAEGNAMGADTTLPGRQAHPDTRIENVTGVAL